jgi:uncharacterized HAD superfamily protein
MSGSKRGENMKIGIDLDDILADFFPSFLNFYNRTHQKHFSIADITNFHIWKIGIGRTKEEAIAFVDEFHDSAHYDLIPPVQGSRESLVELSQLPDSSLYIITSRPLNYRIKTNKFIQKHFSSIPLAVYYSHDFNNGEGPKKSEICQRLEVDFFVEDCFAYAKSCSEKGLNVLLLDKPWNQNEELPKNITRVHNWQEILQQIKGGSHASPS